MTRVEVDPRVGGSWAIVENRGGEDVEHSGEYLTLDRARKLAFTARVPKYSTETDTISIDLTKEDQGCVLTLTHEFSDKYKEQADGFRAGWVGVINGLARLLDDKILLLEESIDIQAPAEHIWSLITDPKRNTEWISLWWPGTRLESDWKGQGSPMNWLMEDGNVGAKGNISEVKAPHYAKFSFCVQGLPFQKIDFLTFTLKEQQGRTRLTVSMGDFADTPEHEACYPGATQSWGLSLPKIKAMAEQT
jgi:uncharacterized protein YndB with AHSA1/START domain